MVQRNSDARSMKMSTTSFPISLNQLPPEIASSLKVCPQKPKNKINKFIATKNRR
jgi:hypothetical protein